MPYHHIGKVCLPISTLLQVYANRFIDTIDTDENMYALASTAYEHYQITCLCRSQIELPLETERFEVTDLTGKDDMDLGAFNDSDVPVLDAVDKCHKISVHNGRLDREIIQIQSSGLAWSGFGLVHGRSSVKICHFTPQTT
jgi:hypothetical protein